MSLRLAGLGWVTPLGNTLSGVWEKLCAGQGAVAQSFGSAVAGSPGDLSGEENCFAFSIPPEVAAEVPRHPRLRRVSAISRYAVAAGLAALQDAGVELDASAAERTALIFAISNGGVIYTKRFYDEIVRQGAQAASPLLFPETVFNAPASHLAALLGITGATYTLVGDGAVGLLALRMAADVMASGQWQHCLIVGAEEVDALICDAYRRWRLVRARPPIEPFARPPRGTLLSEGAGAVLLGGEGAIALEEVDAGGNFFRQEELTKELRTVAVRLTNEAPADVYVASANGTFLDRAEQEVAAEFFPEAALYTAKPALGESIAAGALWQVMCAALALRRQELPPLLGVDDSRLTTIRRPHEKEWERAVVSTCGMSQQLAGLVLRG